jgi:hypothetical protein
MQIISMEVSVILFAIGEYQSEQDIILEEINTQLKVTSSCLPFHSFDVEMLPSSESKNFIAGSQFYAPGEFLFNPSIR